MTDHHIIRTNVPTIHSSKRKPTETEELAGFRAAAAISDLLTPHGITAAIRTTGTHWTVLVPVSLGSAVLRDVVADLDRAGFIE